MKPEGALTFSFSMDLTEPALEEAVLELGPAWIYAVTINSAAVIAVKNLLRTLHLKYTDNPFSPYFNLRPDPSYVSGEWSVKANNKVFWSPGA